MIKRKLFPIKEMLFTFLAINKILYWVETITEINPDGLGDVVEVVLMRLLNRDLILILGVVGFFLLDRLVESKKSKHSNILENVIFYAIGYVGLMVIVFIYNVVINLIFEAQDFSLGEFARAFLDFLPSGTLGYLAVVVVMEIKQGFKSKEKKLSAPAAPNTDDKLAMLKVLLDHNILTQNEFDQKSAKLRD
jgi:hypothetical protein